MGSVISCFGLRFGVRTNAPDLWSRIVGCMPLGSEPAAGTSARFVYSLWVGPPASRRGVRPMSVLYRNSARLVRSAEPDEIFAEFESDLLVVAAKWSPHYIFLPAAGVGIDARAVVVVCSDPRLEDRIVDELVRQGGARCARDYAPFDGEGRLVPSVARRWDQGSTSISRIDPLPVGVLALVELAENEEAELERIGPAFATVKLAALATTAAGTPDSRLATLSAVCRSATVVRFCSSQPAAIAGELMRLLASCGPAT